MTQEQFNQFETAKAADPSRALDTPNGDMVHSVLKPLDIVDDRLSDNDLEW